MQHLWQDRETGRVGYRRVVPVPLRPLVGKSEIKRTLGVRLLPGAKELPAAALARYVEIDRDADRLLSNAAARLSGVSTPLDAALIATLVAADAHHLLAGDDANRADDGDEDALFAATAADLAARTDTRSAWAGNRHRRSDKRRDDLETHLALLRQAYGRGDAAFVADDALDLCAANALAVDDQSPDFRRLCVALLAGRIATTQEALGRLDGAVTATPPKPAAALPAPAPARHSTVSEVAAACALSEGVEVATGDAYTTAARYFRSLHGEVAIDAVTKAQAVAFKAALQRLPARLTAKERALPLAQLIDRYADAAVARLTPTTVNQHVATLARVWKWAAGHGHVTGDKNPFADLKIKRASKAPRARESTPLGFSLTDLQRLFSTPIFRDGERPVSGRGEAAYWLPLMALFTAARREELAMLMVRDFTRDAASGRWMLTIGDPTPHPAKGPRQTKTKTQRAFPLPAALIRLGILDYVAGLRDAGETALFPKMTPAGKRRQLGLKWGEWWSAYVKGAGINVAEPVHGFRHAWTTAARDCGVPKDAREVIEGHKGDGGANDRYGDRSVLGKLIDTVSFRGLDLGSLESPGAAERAAAYRW